MENKDTKNEAVDEKTQQEFEELMDSFDELIKLEVKFPGYGYRGSLRVK